MFDISLWERISQKKIDDREKERKVFLSIALPKLSDYFGGKRVKNAYLFGSLLEEGEFFEFSDIDIAVEGLEGDYLRVLVELEELLDRPVDLVELETCSFRDVIVRHGKKVL